MARIPFVTCGGSGGTVALMHPEDYAFLYHQNRCLHSSGSIDWEQAVSIGIRIFVFKDSDQNTEGTCGTTKDLEDLESGGKIKIVERLSDHAMYVPFAKSRPLLGDEIFAITAEEFRTEFGDDAWTSRFARATCRRHEGDA